VGYSRILDLFLGNDMSQVHGSVDLVISGALPDLPLTDGNGG
jgi:hypothetical protein